MNIYQITSTENEKMIKSQLTPAQSANLPGLEATQTHRQTIKGFGGCFNENGDICMADLTDEQKGEIYDQLFSDKGCRFSFCRLPIGASDYAEIWYSHNETSGDYAMDNFSISRDHKHLIPMIKRAQAINPDIEFFASPWSPPTWMKKPAVFNGGKLIWTEENLTAYALYFAKFIQAYQAEGIKISRVFVQNEPVADQKFPSCLFSGKEIADFTKRYLGPTLEKIGVDCQIYFGTINAPTDDFDCSTNGLYKSGSFAAFIGTAMADPEAKKYIKGVGYQWAGKHAVAQTHASFPDLDIIQTENECGDGRNTYFYAQYMFDMMWHYFTNGTTAYTYWNMALQPTGKSSWGWQQNSMITVDGDQFTYNHEFYLMKHFSAYIDPGAVRLETKGELSGTALAFKNPDGRVVFVISNSMEIDRQVELTANGQTVLATLKADSFSTVVFA